MASISLERLSKTYDNGFTAVSGLDLDIADGEFLVLVGPSGCGKSTALRMIAGLEAITDGTLSIGSDIVNHCEPKDRNIAMVFQNYALYPHMTVGENIGFSLKVAGVKKADIKRRVASAADILELRALLDERPAQLSGGQRQRVAMGRAIVRQPAAFLMDEPLSNLDAKLRVQMRAEISALTRRLGITTVYVTHDQVEAMTMGDRVAVLKDGLLQQVASPEQLYSAPANVFVAAFIGSPSMNLLHASVQDGTLVLGSQELEIDPRLVAATPRLRNTTSQPLIVGIRPESMEDAALVSDPAPRRQLAATVSLVESLGAEVMVHFQLAAQAIAMSDPDTLEELDTATADDATSTAVGRFLPTCTAKAGDRINVVIDTSKLHFFDPDTRLSIT